MKTWKASSSYAWVIVRGSKTAQVTLLKQTKKPWWKGGGYMNTFVISLPEATLLNYLQALEMQAMYVQSGVNGTYEARPVGLM